MSRLNSFIRRMTAQVLCLEKGAQMVETLPGHILEIGLGNGRTYDHLREVMPTREIYVFDFAVNAHPDCIPPEEHLFLGDIHDTIPKACETLGANASLIHSDVGTGDDTKNKELADWLATQLPNLLTVKGVFISNQAVEIPGFVKLPLPEGIQPDRYFMYQRHH